MLQARTLRTALAALLVLAVLGGLPRETHAADAAHGASCAGQADGRNACNVNGCFVCASGVWVDQPLYLGASAATCDADHAGLLRWTGTSFQGCDGSNWGAITAASSGILLGTTATATNPQRSGDAGTGLFTATASSLSIATKGIEVLRVTATQSVGIGTTTPAQKLDVAGSVNSSNQYFIAGNNGLWQDVTNFNIAVGATAFPTTVSQAGGYGNYNTVMGYQALNANTTGQFNTAVGSSALSVNTTGAYNTAVGGYALKANTTAVNNTAVGYAALYSNTTGIDNAAFGHQALFSNTTAVNNTAVGYQALKANTTANNNTAVGYQALTANTTGTANTAVGQGALYTNTTGQFNTAVGTDALSSNTTGKSITAVGALALYANTTGSYNTAVGTIALYSNTTGQFNTGVGLQALNFNTTGSNNTALGYQAGSTVTTGSSNLILGSNVASTTLTTGSHNILIGISSAVDTTAANSSNQLNIGNLIKGDTSINHMVINGTTPGISSGSSDCGTSPTIAGNDNLGLITVGSSTNGGVCTATFYTAWPTAPICFCQNQTTANLLKPVTTTSTLKCTGTLTAGDNISYLCLGYQL